MIKYTKISIFVLFAFIFFTKNVLADDLYEENDTFSTAATISEGSYNLQSDDDDWFKVEVTSPGLLYLKLEHPVVGVDLNMVIYNSLEQVIAANNKTEQTEEVFYHVIVPGVYYIRIFSLGGVNSYTLTLARTYSTSGDDSNENNDYFDTATSIVDYNSPITNQIAKDEDWFTFLSPPGTYTVSLQYDNSFGELELEVYDSLGGRFNNVTGSIGSASLTVDKNTIDNIRIAVVGQTATTYTLTIDHPVQWMTILSSGPASSSSPVIYDVDGDGKGEIIIGTRAAYDSNFIEIKPAQLVCLEDDGSIKWTQSFPAVSIPDPITGHTYNSSSIASQPAVGDVDGDGELEIVVSVGADLDTVHPSLIGIYSPGHKGAVYSLDAQTGNIEWSRVSIDRSGPSGVSDGLPDGIVSSPVICDVNQDGVNEIAWGSWDMHVYLVDGRNGEDFGAIADSKWPVLVHDTNWSSPICADINDDGLHEILIGGDITENPDAFTQTGGLFHVYDRWGRDIVTGFNSFIEFIPGSGDISFLKGKYEEQTIWSSPVVGDLDGDGFLEIAYGTGLFKDEPSGDFVKIWNHDGSLYLSLTTIGRTYATPLFADLDNDGYLEIIVTTARGYVHAWDRNGNALFSTQTFPSGGFGAEHPIYSSPLAVDLDNDGNLEIIYQQGVSLTIVDYKGVQLTDYTQWGLYNEYYRGTPAIDDINGDGNIDIITGGANAAHDTGIVFNYKFGVNGNGTQGYQYARRQFKETGEFPLSSKQIARRKEVSDFVSRFYTEVLERTPDSWGLSDWVNRLMEGDKSGTDVGKGFVLSNEFIGKGKTDSAFVTILYKAFFNRAPDSGGLNNWLAELASGTSREQVLSGFTGSLEFDVLSNSFNIAPSFQANQGLNRVMVTEFVDLFYNQVLKRESDLGGLNGWVDALMYKTLTGADVGNGFINSSEFVNRGLTDIEYVKVLYRSFFGRSADDGGLNGWVSALEQGALTRQEVLDGFVSSQEFINLANNYGIKAF